MSGDGRPLIAGWHEPFGVIVVLVTEKFLHFLLQVTPRFGIHEAQLLLVDEHGLLRLPFLPGLLRHRLINLPAILVDIYGTLPCGSCELLSVSWDDSLWLLWREAFLPARQARPLGSDQERTRASDQNQLWLLHCF